MPIEVVNQTSQDVLVYKGTHTGMVELVSLVEVSLIMTCNPPITKVTTQPVNEVRLDDELETLCQGIDNPFSDQEKTPVRQLLWQNQEVFKLLLNITYEPPRISQLSREPDGFLSIRKRKVRHRLRKCSRMA